MLSLLRNSLEIKGAKEAQRKLEQDQPVQRPYAPYEAQSRPNVQQPSTDVTAPLQPKIGNAQRHNVSPFTAASLLDRNTPPAYKFHVPKAMDSIRGLEEDTRNYLLSEKYPGEVMPVISNTPGNTDLDGIAALLAARIRTKAELKQVSL